jgi:hypothetical protein
MCSFKGAVANVAHDRKREADRRPRRGLQPLSLELLMCLYVYLHVDYLTGHMPTRWQLSGKISHKALAATLLPDELPLLTFTHVA